MAAPYTIPNPRPLTATPERGVVDYGRAGQNLLRQIQRRILSQQKLSRPSKSRQMTIFRTFVLAFTAAVFISNSGCNEFDFKGGLPVGGIVESSQPDAIEVAEPGGRERPEEDQNGRDRKRRNFSFDFDQSDEAESSTPSAEPRAGSRTSEPLPSKSEKWGKDRSMPSDSMPSRTEKWGKERSKPNDSMPSKTEKWGKDRKMPSDTGFRKPLPSESR